MVVANTGRLLAVGDVRTGKIQAYLPYTSLKWGERLNAPGPVTATIRPYSDELAGRNVRALTATVKQFAAVIEDGIVLEAGPIWTRPFDEDTGELTINALGLWSIFDRRKNLNGAMLLPGAKVTEDVITVTGRHPGSVARELVRISIEDNPYGGDLPVVLPAEILGGYDPRVYYGYNLSWLGDDLRDLTKTEGGADLRFRPRLRADDPTFIEWVLEHGAVDIIHQAGPDWTWDVRVEKSGIAKLGVSQDGTGLASKSWVPGSGQEQAMRLASAMDTALVDAGFPWTEAEESASQEEDLGVLQSMANRKQADSRHPWDTWSLTVRADTEPRLGKYLPGDWALVNTPETHPVLPLGGKIRVRILAVDGDHSNDVKLSVAPIQGVDGSATESVTIADPNAAPIILPVLAAESTLPSTSLILTS